MNLSNIAQVKTMILLTSMLLAAPVFAQEVSAQDMLSGEQIVARVQAVLEADHRSEDNRARDRFRHPATTLAFFGWQPHMAIAEIWPAGG